MKKYICPSLIITLVIAITSCKLEEEPAKQLDPFNKIFSNGSSTITLMQGAENKVISTNISETNYNVSSGTLWINASGGTMTVAVQKIDLVELNGSNINNSGTLTLENLNLDIHAGSADFNDIHITKTLTAKLENTGTYKFTGTANYLYVDIANSPYLKAFDLITDSTNVYSNASVNMEIHVTQILRVTILSSADILYKGNPAIVDSSYVGSGRAIAQ